MNPKDWKNRSEIKLPWKPNKFLILVSLGKMKLGSSGEYEKSAINKKEYNLREAKNLKL